MLRLSAAATLFTTSVMAFLSGALKAADTAEEKAAELSRGRVDRELVIVVLSGEELGVPMSDLYLSARKVIEANTALDIGPLDAISIPDRESLRRRCAGDGKCFATELRTKVANAGLLLTVSVGRAEGVYLLGLRLVDVDTGVDLGAVGGEIPLGMSLLGAMEEKLQRVFPSDVWGWVSSLSVESAPAGAGVAVGRRACVTPCELKRMVPGVHELTVRKDGYLPWTGSMTLHARQPATVQATLHEVDAGFPVSAVFWITAVILAATAALGLVFLRGTESLSSVCVDEDPARCHP